MNEVSAMNGGGSGARLAFPVDYFDNVICYNGEQTKLRYNIKGDYRAYQADAFQGWGQYDLAVKLPPVPSGLYEFRLFYSPMGHGGMMQFYIGESPKQSDMVVAGGVFDARIDPNVNPEKFGYVAIDAEAEEYVVMVLSPCAVFWVVSTLNRVMNTGSVSRM